MLLRTLTFLGTFALSSCLYADSFAWETTGQNMNNFGKVDLSTGSFSTVGSFGFQAAGLGEIGSTVYTAVEGGLGLYAVNTNNGNVSSIGDSSISYFAFGSTNSGLYMVDTTGGLWNINPTSGTSTLIGSTHLNINTSVGLSAGSNNLYLALGSNVYTINTTTGTASYVGNSGSTDFGALVDSSGTVYGASIVSPNAFYTFNSSTGTANFVALSAAPDYAFGLAPVVPEPSPVALLGLAGVLFGTGYAWKRRQALRVTE